MPDPRWTKHRTEQESETGAGMRGWRVELSRSFGAALRVFFAALGSALSLPAAAEDPISLGRVTFVTSPKWYLLRNMALDDDVLTFRKYSFAVIDGKIAGVDKTKNILDFGCQRTDRFVDYVVFHFPNWANTGLSNSDWKPKLPLHVGINNLSLTFDAEAELKNGNVFIDLNDRYKQNLLKAMTAQSIVVDFGFGDKRLNIEQRTRMHDGEGDVVGFVDDFVTQILSRSVNTGKITSYDTGGMLSACLAYKRNGKFQ